MKVNLFDPESIGKYIYRSPDLAENVSQLAFAKAAIPAIGAAGIKSHRDADAVEKGKAPENEFRKGLLTSTATGATLLPLAAAGLYLAGRGKGGGIPLSPSMRQYVAGAVASTLGGGLLGAGAYSMGRGAQHAVRTYKKIDELNTTL